MSAGIPDWIEKTEALQDEFFTTCMDGEDGFQQKLDKLLDEGYDINCEKKHHCRVFTPLSWAIYFEQMEVTKYLISHGADIRVKFDVGMAKLNDNKKMIDYLSSILKKGDKQ